MASLDRRSFLLGAAGTAGAGLLAAACGDDSADSTDGDPDAPSAPASVPAGTIAFLVPTFPDGFRAPSAIVHSTDARIAYVLRGEETELREDAPLSVEFAVTLDGEPVAGGAVDRRIDGIITPYYPIRFTPPTAGVYTVNLPEHPDVAAHQFTAVEPGENVIPLPGGALPGVDTPTFTDNRGVTPICTRADPCPFHEINLVDALAARDKPVVLSIATPGFCQTAICGPVIELLIDEAGGRDDLHVVHAEVYVDPQRDFENAGGLPETVPIVDAYGLPFEPVLFVVNPDGTIVSRLDTIYDRSELAEALALV